MTHPVLDGLRPGTASPVSAPWRQGAWSRLERDGVPHRRQEAWRTTDPAPFLDRLAQGQAAEAQEPPTGALVLNADGTWTLPAEDIPGIRARSLEDACEEGTAVSDWLAGTSGAMGLADVVRAGASGGGVLEIAGIIEQPLRVWRTPAAGAAILPPLFVVLAPGARVVIEDLGGAAGTLLTAGHGVVGPDARLHWVRHVSAALGTTWWQDTQSFRVEAGGELDVHVVVTGASWLRMDLPVALVGENASFSYRGLLANPEDGHADLRLDLRHLASRTTSRQVHRGLHGRGARGIFTGLVHVAEGVGAVRSDQELRALMLAEGASALCQPQLEILADDVACSHGATVGQLDEDALFYLRARGLDAPTARALLAAAFAQPALEGLPAGTAQAVRTDLARAGLAEVGS